VGERTALGLSQQATEAGGSLTLEAQRQQAANSATGRQGGRRWTSASRGPTTMRLSAGYWGARHSCTNGRSTALSVGSMTSTTSSMNPPSQLWPGGGPGATGGEVGRGRQEDEELGLNQRIRRERPLWLPPTTFPIVSPAAKQQPTRMCQPASERDPSTGHGHRRRRPAVVA
jgi:hypothetical protein